MSASSRAARDAAEKRATCSFESTTPFGSTAPLNPVNPFETATPFDVVSPFDCTSPRKRWAPPGWELNTTITSHGLKASEIVLVDNCRCQDHRQRYPEVEAIIQMFFRVCAIILNVIVLIIVRILDTDLQTLLQVNRLYGGIAFSFLLNTIELLTLSNPQSTLLIHLFPSLLPAIPSKSSPELQPRFPRLPSLALCICELAAMTGSFCSAITFLNPKVEGDALRNGCPVVTCVTPEEHDMIYGYMIEAVIGLVHCGFFSMAFVHYAKRKGPGWLERLER
ncbi:uncharacterized protein CC84DRAFT_1174853 [Paraphaeosphaeria sporulosa]|uniref:Uncharacterized protein n=1 Tax=Paraphaeosphaeria sporulosa TaxID=1460663 RepID=A0A177CJB8_9PLEO|nr:uncharacterized protein CC84DRAFT_1174853 [Paraphaeosphaeria sporulosa]OAG06958.1 hypothetical protein CC84DRAFT_1174853 [Paraphaeosphaeria sporulosa]